MKTVEGMMVLGAAVVLVLASVPLWPDLSPLEVGPTDGVGPTDEATDEDAITAEVVAPVALLDQDGEGRLESTDLCPSAPEDLDGFEDHDGCPDPDNDGDGVVDDDDGCPDTPEDANGINDHDGCPELLEATAQAPPPSTAAPGGSLPRRPRAARRGRRRISLELVRADVRDVLRLLAREGEVNIVYGEKVKGTITASLHDAPLEDIFVAVLRSSDLWYETSGAGFLVSTRR